MAIARDMALEEARRAGFQPAMPPNWEQIRNGIFAGESGGDYNALFGYSNRPGQRYEGVNLTDMTVDEALQFANPSGDYGQWVKGQVGHVATPMGAYQIVGTTLRHAKEGLGLTGNEQMTPELQEQLGQWIYQQQGTGAWEGYKGPQDKAPDLMQGRDGIDDLMGSAGNDRLAGGGDEFRSIMDPREDEKGTSFHPGLGLSSLGAAIAASAENRSAAQDLEAIRKNYFGQRASDDERQRKHQSRIALTNVVKDKYPQLAEALANGADPEAIMPVFSQFELFEQQRGLQEDAQAHDVARDDTLHGYALDVLKENFGHDTNMADLEHENRIELFEKTVLKDIQMAGIGQEHRKELLDLGYRNDLGLKRLAADLGLTELEQRQAFEAAQATLDREQTQANFDADIGLRRDAFAAEQERYKAADSNAKLSGQAAKDSMVSLLNTYGQDDLAKKFEAYPVEAFQDPKMLDELNSVLSGMAPASGPDTIVDMSPKYIAAMNAKMLEENSKKTETLRDMQNDFSRMEALISIAGDGLNTGKVDEFFHEAKMFAADLGLGNDEFKRSMGFAGMIDALSKKLATNIKTSGAISDFEFKTFIQAMPNIGTPKEQLMELVRFNQMAIDRSIARDSAVAQLLGKQKPDGSTIDTYQEAAATWDEMAKRGDKGTRPIYIDATEFTDDNLKFHANNMAAKIARGQTSLLGTPIRDFSGNYVEFGDFMEENPGLFVD